MPYQQLWVDPNTGATFPQSYVRVLNASARPLDSLISMQVARYASVTCYSLGYGPLERHDIVVQGTQYVTSFNSQVSAAQASFNNALAQATDGYAGSLPMLMGASQAP